MTAVGDNYVRHSVRMKEEASSCSSLLTFFSQYNPLSFTPSSILNLLSFSNFFLSLLASDYKRGGWWGSHCLLESWIEFWFDSLLTLFSQYNLLIYTLKHIKPSFLFQFLSLIACMESRQQSGLPLFSTFFSAGLKPPQPENLTHNSHISKHPSPPHGDYKPNSLCNNPPCHFQNPPIGIIDLNYSDHHYHHHQHSFDGSSLNPFDGGVYLPTIEQGYDDPFDACYNHYSSDVKVFPYASSAADSFSDSQKAIMHGDGYEGYYPYNHHVHEIRSVQSHTTTAQSVVGGVEFISPPVADEQSCNLACQSKKKRHVVKKKEEGHDGVTVIIKGQWTKEEDKLLIDLVKVKGVKRWSEIATLLEGRVGKQCRERWHNHLRPDIRKDTWSEQEDRILIAAHKVLGNKWSEIVKRLPGRTENTIKNHWNATKRKRYIKRNSTSKINLNAKGNNPTRTYVNESLTLFGYIKSVEKLEEKKKGKAAQVAQGRNSALRNNLPNPNVYRCRKTNCDDSKKVMKKEKEEPFDLHESEVYRPRFESGGWYALMRDAAAARKKKSREDSASVEATMGGSCSSFVSSEFNGYGYDTRLSLDMMHGHVELKKPDVDLVEMINNAPTSLRVDW